MSILISIGMWLLKIATGPLVQSLVKTVLTDLEEQGKAYLPIVLDCVKQAANSVGTGPQKFQMAFDCARAKFPDVPTSVLNSVINLAYRMTQQTSP